MGHSQARARSPLMLARWSNGGACRTVDSRASSEVSSGCVHVPYARPRVGERCANAKVSGGSGGTRRSPSVEQRAMDRAAPSSAICSELMPRGARDAKVVERLVDRAPVRHQLPARRPRRWHPRCEHAPRCAFEAHAVHMPKPGRAQMDLRVCVACPFFGGEIYLTLNT